MKTLNCIIFLFFLVSLGKGFSQTKLIDSLRIQFTSTTDLKKKVEFLTAMGYDFDRVNLDSMQLYAEKAVSLSNQIPDEKELALGAKHLLAKTYKLQRKIDTAIAICQSGILEAKDYGLKRLEGMFYTQLGGSQCVSGDFDQAMKNLLLAADIFEEGNMTSELANNHNSISIVYLYQNDTENGSRYLQKSIDLLEKMDSVDPMRLALGYLNLAYAHSRDSSSGTYTQIGYEYALKSGKPGILTHAYVEKAYQHEKAGEYQKALEFYEKNLDLSLQLNDLPSLADAYRFKGNALWELGQRQLAIENLEKGLETYKKANSTPVFLALNLDMLAEAYAITGNYEKAYQAAQERSVFQDSSYSAETLKISSELEAKYENQKQATELANQSLELEKQKNLRNRIILISLVALLLAFIIFQLVMMRRRRQQQETEQALYYQQAESKKLKELDQIKSNFFANISHEFRTPLTLIISPLKEIIQGEFKGNLDTYYKVMLRNGERLLQLINQLLDLSKLESKEMHVLASKLEMNTFLQQVAGSFESLAIRKQIDFEMELENLPTYLWLDKDKTEKIINNLLSNAFKFTKEEGKVVLRLKQQSNEVQLTVEDSGIGIPNADLPHIFDRFYQVDPSKSRSYDGTGIGLALTKELVEIQHGTISVSSKEGVGTVFSAVWPLGNEHFSVEEIAHEENKTVEEKSVNAPELILTEKALNSEAPVHSNGTRILLVEDNDDVRFYLREKLQDKFIVSEASNGKIGLQKAIEEVPDLIVTDVMMPEMDGNELSHQLRQHTQTSHIPVIMLTARGDLDSKLAGLQTGADDYLTKPVESRELLVRINNLIAQRQQLREKFAREIIFSSGKEDAKSMSQDEKFMHQVMEILQTNLEDEEFGVEELARSLHLSRYQLLRKIKALTGKSVSVFIRWVRLNRAKELLEKDQGTVSEIAFRMGFNSVAYFSSCFKEEFGIPPSKVALS